MTDRNRTVVTAAFVLVASAVQAPAQIPLGIEFRVDTREAPAFPLLDSTQAVAIAPDGGFVVVWTAGTADPDVIARRFDVGGLGQGPDFLVNASTTGPQHHPAVGVDDSGRSVVVWTRFTAGVEHVFGQRLDSSGNRLGVEFQVSTDIMALTPSIAVAPAGDFVVVWQRSQGAPLGDIGGRRFDASGSPVGAEFQVNTTGGNTFPTVDIDGAGNFVVVWSRESPPDRAFGRRFSASGVPQGPEFQVSSTVNDTQRLARVAGSPDGSFVVAWEGSTNYSAERTIRARRFDANGLPLGADFTVSGPLEQGMLRPGRPAVAMDADGDFVITWSALDDPSDLGIFGARFDSSGVPAGSTFRVNTYRTGRQEYPRIGTDAAGNFVVAWFSHQNGIGVFARRYAGGLSAAALAVDDSAGRRPTATACSKPGRR